MDIINSKRINVALVVGIIGPQFLGNDIGFFLEINYPQKGWLDKTILTNKLRVFRGYKGKTFALLKRDDLSISNVLSQSMIKYF